MITHQEARKELRWVDVVSSNNILNAYISQQEILQAEHEALKKDVAKLMYYLEYKEKWTEELEKSLNFYYYKVLNKVGKKE